MNAISTYAVLSSTSLIMISSRSITYGSITAPLELPNRASPEVASMTEVPEYATIRITTAKAPTTPITGILGFNKNFLFFLHKKESKIYH